MRTFRCRECGDQRETDTTTGPLPSICDHCDPAGAAKRLERREMQNAAHARRASEVEALRRQVAELKLALQFDQDADRRAILIEPGRESVARYVRKLAVAKGRTGTATALLELAAACRSWARRLATAEPRDQIAA